MRALSLTSWRYALLASFGLMSACSTSNDPMSSTNAGTGGTGAGGTGAAGGETGGSSGIVHRPEPATCDPIEPRPESQIPAGLGGQANGYYACEFDADCDERAHGRCVVTGDGFVGSLGTACSYGCTTDADCGENTVCDCDAGGTCVPADCTTDADCATDNLCLRTRYDDGCHVKTQYRCQTADDTCAEDADCPEEHQCGFLADEGRHACLPSHLCNAGRPFLVRGDERLADARRTTEWLAGAPTSRGTLTGKRAAVLAASWTRVGLMEHASIAAFARFALQLLALGAPPDLVSATSEAMIDETRHAQIAFGLASRYGAEPIGPGKLSMDAALEELDIESILVNAILEGCCGETAAAYEVALAAEGAADPELRETLARIAEDERRHADLAWNFVRWSLQRNPALKTAALRAVELELAQARALPPAPLEDAWLEEHGVLPEARRQSLRVEALEQLVLPCMRSLCAALPQASVGETGARTELAGELSRSLPHHQILEGLANCDLVL